MNIVKAFNQHNTSVRNNRRIDFIVIHYTAGTRSAAGAAMNTAKYFASPEAAGSADFIVDDGTIVQYNPDIKNRYCWSVGGKKYAEMTTSEGAQFYGMCTNVNSISIEMCSNKTNTSSLKATDTDWFFTLDTINNTVKLTKYLMELYNIKPSGVIMHHQVNGKVCPNPWVVNEHKLSGWIDFKNRLSVQDVEQEDDEEVVRYAYLKDITNNLFHGIIDDLMTAKIIAGDGSDPNGNGDMIDLSHDMVRMLVFEYRAGVYDDKLIAAGCDPNKYR